MNTKQKKIQPYDTGVLHEKEELELFAKAGWTFANVCLFYNQHFYDHELKRVRGQIYRFISNTNNPYDAYMEFCQRILLAVDYFTKYQRGAFCMNACVWFQPSCKNGYAKTGSMYERLLKKREKNPSWKKQWKPLAEAVLEISEGHIDEKFEYWINWFEERKADYELFIFLRAIDFQTFKSAADEECY
jgi:hypothetical protein